MAIFLIKDRDATHSDPVKDIRGCYKLGDNVEVYEDTKPCNLPPAEPFYLVKITGLTKAEALYLMASIYEGVGDQRRPVRRRAYGLSQADIPGAMWTMLTTTRSLGFTEIGQPAINWGPAARNYIRHKVTGDPA